MSNYHFISYSAVDGVEFALRLCDELQSGPPAIEAWLDKRRLQTGFSDWDEQIQVAIRDCESLIFVMTLDSVEDASVCKNEWVQALKFKKPILLVRFHDKVDPPFRLNSRQYLDFSSNFEAGLARLRKDLQHLSSSRGILKAMEYRLNDAQRDLRRASDPTETARITEEIAQLKKQIAELKHIINNPQAAAEQTAHNIQAGLTREHHPEKPTAGVAHSKYINPPPDIAPTYFQDRHIETQLIGEFLKDPGRRLLTIVGRGGVGKTAMACRLLKGLENGHLPDELGSLSVDGIVYLGAKSSRRINTNNILTDLGKLLPVNKSQELDALYKDPQINTEAKVHALLAAFPQGRTVVLLDNLEDLIDPETRRVQDAELDEALHALLAAPPHAVKVILTTRISPRDWLLIHPARQQQILLDEGLRSPYAENILREMDTDGKVGLKQASESLLNRARIYTRGYPRALVALYGILSADRYTTLEEVLSKPLPDHVVEALVGEAFNRLDPISQKVMEALAVYERPVSPAAVDYLLQPFDPGINSAPVLNRLVNMQFVRKEGSRYYQHATDRDYALARIPKGEKQYAQSIQTSFPQAPYTQFALLHRGAEYFRKARQPREAWKKLEDLTPQLNEFELRCAGEDYDTAASVLLEIDFDYLLPWGHRVLMIGLHERLQGKIEDPDLKQKSVGNLGSAYSSTGQSGKAMGCYQAALCIARGSEDRGSEGKWLGALGNCYGALGQSAWAIEHYDQALAIAREVGDRGSEGTWLGNLGNRYGELGQTAQAIEHYDQALAIAREIGNRRNEGLWLGNLGSCYADQGQTAQAIEHYDQALAIAREIGNRGSEGGWLGALGSRYADLGQTAQAIEHYDQALAIAREIGDRGSEGSWLGNLGSCYADLGQSAQALEHYDQALAIAREIGDRRSEGTWLGALGSRYADLGQTAQAIEHYDQALAIAREIGDRRNEGTWLGNLGNRYAGLGQTAQALEHYDQALAIAREIGNRFLESAWLIRIGESQSIEEQYKQAVQSCKHAIGIADEIENRQCQNVGRYHLGYIYFYQNDLFGARTLIEEAGNYDYPPNNHHVAALLGVISLRQNDQSTAKTDFRKALDLVDKLINHKSLDYKALDTKGLALVGLALCGESVYLTEAEKVYYASRAINKDAGYVKSLLRLFNALAIVDNDNILGEVRKAAAG